MHRSAWSLASGLVLAACASPSPRSVSTTSTTVPSPPPVADAGVTTERPVAAVSDGAERKRVLDAVFPAYLNGPCPDIPAAKRAQTWTDLDRIAEKARLEGLLKPEVQERAEGHFTSPTTNETLYLVRVEECVDTGSSRVHYELVVFDAKDREPTAKLRARAIATLGPQEFVLACPPGELACSSRQPPGATNVSNGKEELRLVAVVANADGVDRVRTNAWTLRLSLETPRSTVARVEGGTMRPDGSYAPP